VQPCGPVPYIVTQLGLYENHGDKLKGIIRSTPKSRPNKVGLRCPSIRPSTKNFSDSDDIWYLGSETTSETQLYAVTTNFEQNLDW